MINTADVKNRVYISKNLITTQNFDYVVKRLNTAGLAFDVTEGLGATTATSTMFFITAAGFPDQKITASMKYIAPTTAGGEDLGVVARVLNHESGGENYYYACVDGGIAKIRKVIAGSFTTLSQSNFALTADTVFTVTFSVIGNNLSATFVADGGSPADVTITATDSSITTGGAMGVKSISSTMYCRSFIVEQM